VAQRVIIIRTDRSEKSCLEVMAAAVLLLSFTDDDDDVCSVSQARIECASCTGRRGLIARDSRPNQLFAFFVTFFRSDRDRLRKFNWMTKSQMNRETAHEMGREKERERESGKTEI
jgi:hypothetical protein